MAGHSKWKNIRYRKGAQDAQKAKIFTKFIREITVASRVGGGDVSTISRLRLAIDKGLAANMPKDIIERAVKRGTGGGEDANLEECRYEGYGAGGVAVMVDCLTNNRNRTAGDVRSTFTKQGGNLGAEGSVSYLFEKKAQFVFPVGTSEEAILEIALMHDADEIETDEDGTLTVLADPKKYQLLTDAFSKAQLKPEFSDINMIPATEVAIEGEVGLKVLKLLDALEDLDDVQQVYSNANITDAE